MEGKVRADLNSLWFDELEESVSNCLKYVREQRVHVMGGTMFGPSRHWLFLILGYLTIVTTFAQNPIEEKTTFEAAFQGKSSFS